MTPKHISQTKLTDIGKQDAEGREPSKWTDDGVALLIVLFYLVGKALAAQGIGWDIPDEVVFVVLTWLFTRGGERVLKKG